MADSILNTITSMTGFGADPAEAMTEEQKQLVLEVNHVSGGYRTPGLFGRGKYQQVLYGSCIPGTGHLPCGRSP